MSVTNALPARRRALLAGLTAVALLTAGLAPARADTEQATALVKHLGDALVAVVNGPGSAAQKHGQLRPIIDGSVDVNTIARFCLGSHWNAATPAQQQRFVALFHQVLVNSITGHLGEFTGVSFTMGETQQRGADAYVSTTVRRPEAAPADVQWVVSDASGAPKVVDVVAEGTSLRLTQRSDYTSYLSQHGQSIDALIAGMQRQAAATP